MSTKIMLNRLIVCWRWDAVWGRSYTSKTQPKIYTIRKVLDPDQYYEDRDNRSSPANT
jgi:hypothetical protein